MTNDDGKPPVAPVSDERRPLSFEELFRRAQHDIGGPLAFWAFQHAKASGRREKADRELKRVEESLRQLQYRASVLHGEAAVELIMEKAPSVIEFHRLDVALADAIEQQQGAANVMQLLAARPSPTGTSGQGSRSPPSAPSAIRAVPTQRNGNTTGGTPSSAAGTK